MILKAEKKKDATDNVSQWLKVGEADPGYHIQSKDKIAKGVLAGKTQEEDSGEEEQVPVINPKLPVV